MIGRLKTFGPAVAIALLAASPLSASDADMATALEAKLKAFKAAFIKQDGATIKSMMAKDGLLITPFYGAATPEEVVDRLSTFQIKSHDSHDVKVTPLGSDDGLMTLYSSLKGTFNGKPLPPWVFASAVWVKEDGAWRVKLYQETTVDAPRSASGNDSSGTAAGN